jgi:DNA-binding LacI/PurR family transcriptional regulator
MLDDSNYGGISDLLLDKSAGVPLYKQISIAIEKSIVKGKLRVGSRLSADIDLAEKLGTSPITVAKAYEDLRKRGLVDRTRGKGTFVARNRKHTGKVLFTCPDVDCVYQSQLVRGICEGLKDSGRDVVIRGHEFGAAFETSVVESIGQDEVDGIITTASLGSHRAYINAIERGLVVIALESVLPDIPFVQCDQVAVGRIAARHLIDLGHRNLYIICSNYDRARERLLGFQIECAKAGIELSSNQIMYSRVYGEGLLNEEELKMFFELDPMPTAVFTYNDTVGIQLYHEALKKGLRIPNDFSLIGVDNNYAQHGLPLTSIEQNLFEVGRQGGLLFSQVADHGFKFKPAEPTGINVEPTLVTRSSTAQLKNNK